MPTAPYETERDSRHAGRGSGGKGERFNLVRFVTGVVAIFIGLGSWMIGARYTIDGIIFTTNWLIAFVQQPYQIEPTSNLYLWLMIFPVTFSVVEVFGLVQFRHADTGGRITWVIIALLDVTTTGFGLLTIDPTSSAVAAWFVATIPVVVLAAILLTFRPEWMVHWGGTTARGTLEGVLRGSRR